MSFFGKLKSRLFKSSSKLEEGLDAIVQEGGESDVAEPPALEADPKPAETPQETPAPDVPETPPGAPPETPEAPQEVPVETPPQETPQPDDPIPDAPAPSPYEPEPAPDVPPPADPEPAPAPEVPDPGPVEMPPFDDPLPVEEPIAPSTPGLIGRLLGRGKAGQAPVIRRVLDDDMIESLEELLIASDMGVDTALRVTANIAEGRYGRRVSTEEIKGLLASEIARVMEPVARPLPLYPTKPQVVLVVGVNGSGKTTTIGKLASQFRAAGKKVVIAAGDTFRAAARNCEASLPIVVVLPEPLTPTTSTTCGLVG